MSRRLILPWPPSVNRYWRSVRGRVLISLDGRIYRDTVATVAAGGVLFGSSRVAVSIIACPPDRRRRDIDNLLKAPLDALTAAGVWDDDSQIEALSIRRGAPTKDGHLVVEIIPFIELANP